MGNSTVGRRRLSYRLSVATSAVTAGVWILSWAWSVRAHVSGYVAVAILPSTVQVSCCYPGTYTSQVMSHMPVVEVWSSSARSWVVRLLGGWPSIEGGRQDEIWVISCPLWLAFLATVCISVILSRLRKPPPQGDSCRQCGYSLIGNVSARCPECGCATKSPGKEDCTAGP